jgi:hypothetical protein
LRRIARRLRRKRTVLSTEEWLHELKCSFRSLGRAQEQCARDWPRMDVSDNRTLLQHFWDYVWGNELVDYFANQSTMAKPFELAMNAVVQDAKDQQAKVQDAKDQRAGDQVALVPKNLSSSSFSSSSRADPCEIVVVQCSQTPFALTIHPSGAPHLMTLQKRLVLKMLGTSQGASQRTLRTLRPATLRSATLQPANEEKNNQNTELAIDAVVRIGSDTAEIQFHKVRDLNSE